MWCTGDVVCFLLQYSTCALATMVTATALLFGDGSQVCWILLKVMVLHIARLRPLFSFTQMDALLLGMVLLLRGATIAAHVGRSLLAFLSTVLALCYRAAFLWHKRKLAVYTCSWLVDERVLSMLYGPYQYADNRTHDGL